MLLSIHGLSSPLTKLTSKHVFSIVPSYAPLSLSLFLSFPVSFPLSLLIFQFAYMSIISFTISLCCFPYLICHPSPGKFCFPLICSIFLFGILSLSLSLSLSPPLHPSRFSLLFALTIYQALSLSFSLSVFNLCSPLSMSPLSGVLLLSFLFWSSLFVFHLGPCYFFCMSLCFFQFQYLSVNFCFAWSFRGGSELSRFSTFPFSYF